MGYLSAFTPFFVYSYLRFFARPKLLALLGPNGDYWFEVLFCGLALLLYFNKLKLRFNRGLLKKFSIALGLGLSTLILGEKVLGLVIPFNVEETSSILLLILWGPILEEFLFRFTLYWPLRAEFNAKTSAFVTALFFSFCHFHAYSIVPETLKSFVIFQTLYTFGIGFWWVREYQKEQNFVAPLGLHILFNFGFYLGLILL